MRPRPGERFDCAVVGAGILGLAHAYHLARLGKRVLVVERDHRAQGASTRNFGTLWPIGQPAGELRRAALRSMGIWREVLADTKLWHRRAGSLHLAYHEDEHQVLREFAGQAVADDFAVELWTPGQAIDRCPALRAEGLQAALWSSHEVLVDPRQVLAELPGWLQRRFGVVFAFGSVAAHYSRPLLLAGGIEWSVERLFVCSGDDLATLYPEVLERCGLLRCKLQMLRSEPWAGGRIDPLLAGGLTLRHYRSFETCPTLPALRSRVARETPELDRYGIHVLAAQNDEGEIIIGDSHEYGEEADPFDKQRIEDLILGYLGGLLRGPAPRIASRWHGIYVKNPEKPWIVERPEEGVTIVTGLGGMGMTMSFGLAEEVVRRSLEEES